MSGIRSFSKGLAVFMLFLILLALPVIVSIQMTLNAPDAIKHTIAKSGIYDTVSASDILLENSDLSSAATSDEIIASALNAAITPAYVKSSSEKLIDEIYNYIHGDVPAPELSIDVSDVKAQFADNVAQQVKQKFESLPVCTELKIPSTSIESLLGASCAPVGVSSQQASDYARTEIMNTSLFSNDRLDLAGLTGVGESSIVKPLTDLRGVYPYFTALLYGLPILGFILTISILFLSATKRRGVKSIANTLLSAGIINGIVALVVTWLIGVFVVGSAPGGSVAVGGFERIVPELLGNFASWWLGGAAVLLGSSIVLYIILATTRPPKLKSSLSQSSPPPLSFK